MKPRNIRQAADHHEVVGYFKRVGPISCPTRDEGFEIANQLCQSRQAFRLRLLASPTVLSKCLDLLRQAVNKEVRFDHVFELSQREAERIKRIRDSISSVIAGIESLLNSRSTFCSTHGRGAPEKISRVIALIESLEIRIGHLNLWYRELREANEGEQYLPEFSTVNVNERQCQFEADQRVLASCLSDYDTYIECKHSITRGAMKLVVSIAKRYASCRLPMMDLVQEGNCGLLVAIEKYKPELGFAFTTYASKWIQQRILIAAFEKSRMVRLPIVLRRRLADTERELESMAHRQCRFPTEDEALQAATKQKVVERLLQFYRDRFISIQGVGSAVGNENGMLDLPSKSAESASNVFGRRCILEVLRSALSKLDSQHREAVEMRFGFHDKPRSNQRIGESLGVSRETVRTLVRESLKTMRNELAELDESALADLL